MKGKIIKVVTVMLLILTLTMINFIYVGAGFVSLAAEDVSTNHRNVDFTATLNGDNILTLTVTVKNEGYFNGEITLENSNFNLKNSNSEYVNKMEGNKITLNQINAGTTASFDVEIEPVKDDNLDAGLLVAVSSLNLTGVYRDSTERDINIDATREVELQYSENNNEESVENTAEVITNKVITIDGEEKRVVQLSINMGLKENNYPIKEMTTNVTLPEVEEAPEVVAKANFNTMTHFDYHYSGNTVELKFTNEPNNENKILWKKSGCENVILTLVYNKDENLEGTKLPLEQTVKLYNDKEIKVSNTIEVGAEEKDSLVQVTNTVAEDTIYKGRINASLDRTFETRTELKINLANAESTISVREDASYYNLADGSTIGADVIYNRTAISKDSFDKVLGQNGTITILDGNGTVLTTINSATPTDDNGNIVIDYTGKELSSLEIRTSKPVAEGNIEFAHTKTIRAGQEEVVRNAVELVSNSTIDYSTGVTANAEARIKLEESKTDVKLEVNKDTLSTVLSNDMEIRATLRSSNEQYNLYENPRITVELPEPVENITINSIDLVYENELTIANYWSEGRTITVELAGRQTNYKEAGIEGAILVINASVNVNRKSATQDGKVVITTENKGEVVTAENDIKVVAPTDMTVIHSISDLGIETIGQEEAVTASLERGTDAKDLQTQIEVINNNENTMENVKVLGTFPTKSEENNIDTAVTEGLNVQGVEGAKVYYTENENATDDLQNGENGWQEGLTDGTKVRKYLIDVPTMETGASINATYTTNVPASLEYNQEASQDYTVNYQNSLTKATNQMEATAIDLETGVGPNLETKMTASIAGEETQSGGTVRNGEVIKYKIEVSNVGSEDISNVSVRGVVPEGTTLVEPEEHYEYTGASYYKELDNTTYEDTIENLGIGQVATREYEVRVNNDTEAGTNLVSKSSITYGDVTKESEETSLVTANGNIRATTKRVTDRSVDLYETGAVQYFAIIENISDETQNDVIVRTNLPENLTVSRLNLISGMTSEEVTDGDIQSTEESSGEGTTEITEEELTQNAQEDNSTTENIEYQDEINIGSLEPGENKVLSYDMSINKLDDTPEINFSVAANVGQDEYRSNIATDNVRKAEISLSMTANPDGNYLRAGDTVEYTINVRNNGTENIEGLIIKDNVPTSLTVNRVTFDDQEIEELRETNNLEINCDISAGTESTIKIEAVVNYSAGRTEAEAITNVVTAELLGEEIAKTPEITHIIEANEGQNGSGTTNPGGNNNVDDNDIANGTGIITGVAWFDENANGARDDNEELLSGVRVQLYNTETNNLVKKEDGSVLEANTNDNGVYVLDHIGNGNYIVIFNYDDSTYSLTKYKAEGVSETNNSDAIMKELTIDGTSQNVASTDIIEMNEENVSDINIGFIKSQNFDLKLEKFVSRIVIQDSSGSTVREYNDETLARTELDAKRVNGATVLIEYKIRVSNVGEVDGYVRRIADYMPSDLNFSSELNKDWYQTGAGLYNESLANDAIKPGESREVTLTLTKDMTEDNVGLINNTAEIDESYNELGLADSNSIAGNRVNGENDMGSADVLLGIRTGGAIYIAGTIVAVLVLGAVAFIVIRKRTKNKNEEI